MCAADKVWITELTLMHKNSMSVRNSHAQELILILKIIGQYDVADKRNTTSFEDLDIYSPKKETQHVKKYNLLQMFNINLNTEISIILHCNLAHLLFRL